MKTQTKNQDRINTNDAIEIIKANDISVTRTSLLAWIRKYDLGKKVGGRWYVDRSRLNTFLKGETDAN